MATREAASFVSFLCALAACDAGEVSHSATGGSTTSSSSSAGSTGSLGTGGASSDAGTPTIVITGQGSFARAPHAFGQNYWAWIPAWGDPVGAIETTVEGMKLNALRAGGDNNDTSSPAPFDEAQIDEFVAYAHGVGAEPILQVPVLKDASGNVPTAATAAGLVTYANTTKGYGIKYWEIGNEPDLYASGTPPAMPGYTVTDYASTFTAFAKAMKAADPTIQILGPELSYRYVPGDDWLSPFLDQCADVVDIVSVHRYPFDDAECSIANAMGDGATFRSTVAALRGSMAAHGAGSKPLAFTEANLSYEGTSMAAPAALGTFYAGMWVADELAASLEEQLWTLAFWSLEEGNATGFFVTGTNEPRPAAIAYQLVSTHFGPTVLHAATVPTGFSAYASRDDAAAQTIVLVLNQTASDADEVIGFEALTPTPPSQPLHAPAYSITVLTVPDDGSAATALQYAKAMADQGQGPQTVSP